MGWDSADTTWIKTADKRARACYVWGGGYLLVGVGLVFLLLHLMNPKRPDPAIDSLRVLILLAIGVGLWLMARDAWQWWRIRRVVPPNQGVVCLKCIRPLDEGRNCPQCGLFFEVEKVQTYWSELCRAPQAARALRYKIMWEVGLAHRQLSFLRRHRWTGFAYLFFGWLGIVALCHAVLGGSFLGVLLDSLYMLGIASGIMLVGISDRVEGSSWHCAACGYLKSPEHASTTCPECGAAWSSPGGLAKGRRVRHPGLMIGGFVLLGLTFALQFSGLWSRGGLRAALPTRSLIQEVATGHASPAEWATLNSRTLSATEQRALSDAIVGKLENGEHLDGRERDWVANQLLTGSFSWALQESWFERMITLDIHAPDSVRAGASASVRISGRGLRVFDSTRVIVEGFYVGTATDPIERGTVAVSANRFSRSREPFQIDLTRDDPGPLEVRFVYWTVIMPPKSGTYVTWQQDGTPKIPAGTLWSKRCELRAQIQITP